MARSPRRKASQAQDITFVTVNFKTPELMARCVKSIVRFYPDVPIILIDNGGCKRSLKRARALARNHSQTRFTANPRNIGHGPALHQGVLQCRTGFVFTMDSDAEIVQGGFLERMHDAFRDPKLLAIGWRRWVNLNGVSARRRGEQHTNPYVHPYAALMDLSKYRKLPSFKHRGAPSIELMLRAAAEGYHLRDFPIQEYVRHKIAGTRGIFGGGWNVRTDRVPGPYKRKRI